MKNKQTTSLFYSLYLHFNMKTTHHHSSHKNHMLWMIIGCIAPIIVYFVVRAMGYNVSWLGYLIFFGCIFGHLFMMHGMMGSHKPVDNPDKDMDKNLNNIL